MRCLSMAARWIVPLAVIAATIVPAQARDAAPGEVLDTVGRLVERYFFDPAMVDDDWRTLFEERAAALGDDADDAELAAAVNSVLGAFGVSHTQRYTPDQAAYYELLGIFSGSREIRRRLDDLFDGGEVSYVGIGVTTRASGDWAVVDSVYQGGPADRAGLLRGDVIRSADGETFGEITSFEGREGENVTLSVSRERGGEPLDMVVTPERIRPNEAFLEATRESIEVVERDGRSLGYVRIWSYARRAYHEALAESLWRGELSGVDGLVFDLRGGWGGADPAYAEIFVGGGPVMTVTDRDGEESLASFRWGRPVVAVIDEGTRSGKEIVAHSLKQGGVPLVGERTAGAVLAGRAFFLPDDSLLILAVLDVEVDGVRLEGEGVEPDIPVPFEPAFSAGEDPQLEAAMDRLRELIDG